MAESRAGAQPTDRQRQRLAELASELDAARISTSPRDKQFNWSRPATVSSAMPLLYRDVDISEEQRALFQNLELEVLLNEFQTVAASKEQSADDDEPAEKEAPAGEGAEESEWLQEAGFEVLADKVKQGALITDADLSAETLGFTPAQIHAVKQRVDTLNDTLRRTKKGANKADVRHLFGSSDQAPRTPAFAAPVPSMDSEVSSRLTLLTANADEPQTLFFDLSEEDQQQVQCLNLIQVTSILERVSSVRAVGKLNQPKKKKKKEEHLTFGVRLESLVERDHALFKEEMKNSEVPLILTRIVDYMVDRALHEEGIFRKAGSAARTKTLRQTVDDARGDVDFGKLDARAHDVSALLKQFLREIPEPLLTSDCIELFLAVPALREPPLQLYTLQLLVMLLPRANRFCLRMLLDFLALVASQHEINKMNVANLAVVFAPTLFYVKGQKGQKMLKEVDTQLNTAATLRLMLEQHHVLWNVPADIIAQVRFVNEQRALGRKANRPKDMKRLFSDKAKGSVPAAAAAAGASMPPPAAAAAAAASAGAGLVVGDRVGRIKWIKDSTEKPPVRAAIVVMRDGLPLDDVLIFDTTTAQSLVESLKSPSDFCLVECGGNIGCRRLDARTKILPLLRVNPLGTIALMSLSQFASVA